MKVETCPGEGGAPVKILVIEDNDTDIKIFLRALEKAQFHCKVYTVSDGEEALAFILHRGQFSDKYEHPRPDIIILDNQMPKMDGPSFIKELKSYEQFYCIPIIIYTSREGQEKVFEIEGVSDYVVKSVDAAQLITRMKSLLNK